MKGEIFQKGLDLVAENFQLRYSKDFSFEIWKIFKDINNNEWLEICNTIIRNNKYKPSIADFLAVQQQVRTENITRESKEINCAECGQRFVKPITQPEYDDWCSKCIDWRNTEEGRQEMQNRINRLKKRFENIGGLK